MSLKKKMNKDLKTINDMLPFSLACFLCVERKLRRGGRIPDCSKINGTYFHWEKQKMIKNKEITLPEHIDPFYIMDNKPCKRV